MSIVKTRWRGENAGRRYRECGYESCGYFVWIDPPLRARSVRAIEELQERNAQTIHKYRRRMDRLIEVHETVTINLKRKQCFIGVAMFFVFSMMMSTALNLVTPDNVAENYDFDD